MAQLYDRSGSEILVNTQTINNQGDPGITALPSGGYVVVWHDADGHIDHLGGIRAQLFDANHNKVGGEFTVATLTYNQQTSADVTVLASGGFVVTWSSGGHEGSPDLGIRAQIFDAAGQRVGGEFQVNTQIAGHQDLSAVTPLASGGFVVTWTDASLTGGDSDGLSIKAQVFNAAGAKVGSEFLVNTTTSRNQLDSAITSLGSGGFVVTWQDQSRDGRSFSDIRAQVFSADGSRAGSELLVNTQSRFGTDPAITSFGDDGFVITWVGNSGTLLAQLFDAAGNRLGTEFRVDGEVPGGASQPHMETLPGGGFIVTWREKSSSDNGNIYAQVFDASGAKEGPEFLVSKPTVFSHAQPAVAALANSEIVFVWANQSFQHGDPNGSAITAQVYTPADGPSDIALSITSVSENNVENVSIATFSATGAVNAVYTYTLHSDSTLGAFRIEGDQLVVADADRLDHETAQEVSLVVRVTDQNGNSYLETIVLPVRDEVDEVRLAPGPERVLNSGVEGAQARPDVTMLSDGKFALAFADAASGTIKARILDASGNPVGVDVSVSAPASIETHTNPSIASLSSGGFVISWLDYRTPQFRIFDSNAAPVSDIISGPHGATLNKTPFTSVTGLASGGFVLVWDVEESEFGTGRENITAQIYDGAGNKVGGAFRVNTATMGYQGDPAVAALKSGGFVATYTAGGDPSEIKAQMFNADGTRLGVEFTVNTTRLNAQTEAAVAVLADGRFVISWTDFSATGGDKSGTAVRAQMFDAAGTPVGGEVLVPTNVAGDQQKSSIAALPGGGFVVGWQDVSSEGGDGSGTSIKAQRFDAAGRKLGEEFLVNSVTSGNQGEPSLAVAADGSIFVVWSGPDTSTSTTATDVRGRLFGTSPDPQNEVITGTPGDDVLAGGVGNDTLTGGAGNDTLDGGEGTDTADYSREDGGGGVIANLQSGGIFGPGGQIVGANQARDTHGTFDSLLGIENVRTGAGNDSVYGNAAANRIETGAGNDFLLGGAGADILVGGDGDDVYSIRAVDSPTFQDTVNEAAGGGTDEIRTDLASFSLASVANIEVLSGVGASGQRLEGNEAANRIAGGSGNDQIFGGGADDTLSGGEGEDHLDGGTGRDRLSGGGGRDALFGAAAGDLLLGGGAGDLLFGQEGEDDLQGDDGDDYLDGGAERDLLSGGAGRDHLIGGLGSDLLRGDADNDLLFGEDGDDDLRGGDGHDYAVGGRGRDALAGDAGADTIYGGDDTDIIDGGAGEDLLFGDDGDDYVDGGADRDVLFGGAGADNLLGRLGNDSLIGGAGLDILSGGDGDDELRGGDGDDNLQGGIGRDLMVGDGGGDTLYGGADTDVLLGAEGDDLLFGEDGDDHIEGGSERDIAYGGAGRDTLIGGSGNDSLLGEADGDFLYGEEGEDEVRGGDGDDYVVGGLGRDYLFGDAGQDTLYGGVEGDVLFGGTGNDFAFGEEGDDYLDGEAGADVLFGAAGRDTLYGGIDADSLDGGADGDLLFGQDGDDRLGGDAGDDYLAGGAGNDRLIGGLGADSLIGGDGADQFVFVTSLDSAAGAAPDYLADFDAAAGDRIDLSTIDADAATPENEAFTFVGTAAFSKKAGELRYEVIDGRAHVFGDRDGDGTADLVFVVNTPAVQAQDFLL